MANLNIRADSKKNKNMATAVTLSLLLAIAALTGCGDKPANAAPVQTEQSGGGDVADEDETKPVGGEINPDIEDEVTNPGDSEDKPVGVGEGNGVEGELEVGPGQISVYDFVMERDTYDGYDWGKVLYDKNGDAIGGIVHIQPSYRDIVVGYSPLGSDDRFFFVDNKHYEFDGSEENGLYDEEGEWLRWRVEAKP